jgi:hypothetical protein
VKQATNSFSVIICDIALNGGIDVTMIDQPEVPQTGFDTETYNFWLEVQTLEAARQTSNTITANSVAHLADPEGRCSLESRQKASQMLERLVGEGLMSPAERVVIGGDYLPSYTATKNVS